MYTIQSTVSVALREFGETLVSRGKYSTARISVKNFGKFDADNNSLEEFTLLKPSRVIQEPEFKYSTKNLTLNFPFIEMALNLDEKGKSRKPKPPKKGFERWLRSDEGKLYLAWNTSTDAQKIQVQLELLASDMKAELISFKINE